MLRWLILTALVAVCASEPEVVAEEAASPIRVLEYEDVLRSRDDRKAELDRNDREREPSRNERERERGRNDRERDGHGDGPQMGLLLDPSKLLRSNTKGHDTHAEKIIKNVYSPDFYQPTWILDYRYLKTGGREYTRSDGGQILILPKHVSSDQHMEFKDYDQLLEFLRVKQLSESQAHLLHPEEGRRESQNHREERKESSSGWNYGWI